MQKIQKCLGASADQQIILKNMTAKDYFEKHLNREELSHIMPDDDAPFEEIASQR